MKQNVLDEMNAGGKIVKRTEVGLIISDDELRIAIECTKKVIAYLEGRGRDFFLATSALQRDLTVLENCQDVRRR